MTTLNTPHPFSGFGPAPYRICRVREHLHHVPGEYARAGGSCDVCGTGIRWEYTVRADNGVEFVTGCDCAVKAGMSVAEIKEARRAYRNERRSEQWCAERRNREAEERAANKDRYGYALTNVEVNEARAQGEAAAKSWLLACRRYDAAYVGAIGKRARGLELLVERCYSFDTQFGSKEIWTLTDRAGNQVVVKTSAALGMDAPEGGWLGVQRCERFPRAYFSRWFRCDASIKEHSEYKGMRQTVVQRVKVTAILSDWIERS